MNQLSPIKDGTFASAESNVEERAHAMKRVVGGPQGSGVSSGALFPRSLREDAKMMTGATTLHGGVLHTVLCGRAHSSRL